VSELLPASDTRQVWETYLSPVWLPALVTADGLGVLTCIGTEPGSTAEISGRLGLNSRVLGSVLALLASLGYLVPRGGRFQLTDTARQHLLPASPLYWGGVWASIRSGNPVCERLAAALTTPDPADEIPAASPDGRNADSWAAGHMTPDAAASMTGYMHSHSAAEAVAVAQSGLFAGTRRLLDVGGCSGVFTAALADRYPDLTGTILDLPAVCKLTGGSLAERGLSGRIDTHPADMFRQEWPSGYDAVLFANIFHDWRPVTCLGLARRAYAALEPGGTISLQEMLLDDDGAGPRTAAAFSVLMALGTQGQQFTFAQLAALLTQAGFTGVQCHPVSPLYSLIRGYKP
jgi:acetylserotonin N-methyltransferase